MDALIDALLDWIGQNSRYETAGISHPIVIEMTPEELTRELYTGIPHLIPDGGVDDRVNALYAHAEETIYILSADTIDGASDFDTPTENPLWREILLHELVHHVQWETGESQTWVCDAQGETIAYQLGGAYLAQTHTYDPMGNRMFWAQMYARC